MDINDIERHTIWIAKRIIFIKRHKHVRQIEINDIKFKRSSIKMFINDFKLKKLCTGNALQGH